MRMRHKEHSIPALTSEPSMTNGHTNMLILTAQLRRSHEKLIEQDAIEATKVCIGKCAFNVPYQTYDNCDIYAGK